MTIPGRTRIASLAAAILIGLGLCFPALACNLDGMTGPGHGAFGGWAQWTADRHRATPPPSAGNRDSGDSAGLLVWNDAPASDSDEDEPGEPTFFTLPGPAVEVRESGGSVYADSVYADALHDAEPRDLRMMD